MLIAHLDAHAQCDFNFCVKIKRVFYATLLRVGSWLCICIGICFVFVLVFVFVFVRKQTEGSKATSEGLVLFPQRDQVLTKDEN